MTTDTDLLPDLTDLDKEDPPLHIFCMGCFPDDTKPRISYCGKLAKPRNESLIQSIKWRKDDGPPRGVKFCRDCLRIRPNCMKCRR